MIAKATEPIAVINSSHEDGSGTLVSLIVISASPLGALKLPKDVKAGKLPNSIAVLSKVILRHGAAFMSGQSPTGIGSRVTLSTVPSVEELSRKSTILVSVVRIEGTMNSTCVEPMTEVMSYKISADAGLTAPRDESRTTIGIAQ